MSSVVAVIPVRFGAQRFPGKPLVPLLGKPMIHWVIEGVQKSKLIKKIIVATDDQRIADVCRSHDVKVVMTDSALPSGSDRVFQAVLDESEDLVINVQGDEPLIDGLLLDEMAAFMTSSKDWDMVTLGRPLDEESLISPNTAKIVVNNKNQALYFSRYPIPYSRVKNQQSLTASLKHIGIYGYNKKFLKLFCETPPVEMEIFEGLEQLRALYLGARIQVIKVNYQSWGVDTPEDVKIVENELRKLHG